MQNWMDMVNNENNLENEENDPLEFVAMDRTILNGNLVIYSIIV